MQNRQFLCGIIEGFYGRPWGDDVRHAYADFLHAAGLNASLYCPKADPYLRKRWPEPWPADKFQSLRKLASYYRSKRVGWGVGLSPFELYRHYGPREREQMRVKLDQINALQAPLLALLFDDMPGDLDALAERQAEIIGDVQQCCPDTRLLVCPTYYSLDPVLEKHFGPMPTDYWSQLGAALPVSVDIFWTGNLVCSASVSVDDIRSIQSQLGRSVMLWDNYPVNDGAVRSNSLYLAELTDRQDGLKDVLTGHLCNPMNQGWLSLPALAGLARLYGSASGAEGWIEETIGQETLSRLRIDQEEFLVQGLSGMGEQRCAELAELYRTLAGPAAAEVVAWLRGEYAWDPQCLTD